MVQGSRLHEVSRNDRSQAPYRRLQSRTLTQAESSYVSTKVLTKNYKASHSRVTAEKTQASQVPSVSAAVPPCPRPQGREPGATPSLTGRSISEGSLGVPGCHHCEPQLLVVGFFCLCISVSLSTLYSLSLHLSLSLSLSLYSLCLCIFVSTTSSLQLLAPGFGSCTINCHPV